MLLHYKVCVQNKARGNFFKKEKRGLRIKILKPERYVINIVRLSPRQNRAHGFWSRGSVLLIV